MRLVDHLKAQGLSNKAARDAMNTGKVWVSGIPMADGGREVDPDTVDIRPEAPRRAQELQAPSHHLSRPEDRVDSSPHAPRWRRPQPE